MNLPRSEYNLPPGVSTRDIDAHFGGSDADTASAPDDDVAFVKVALDAAVRYWRRGKHALAHRLARGAANAAIEDGCDSAAWEAWGEWMQDYGEDMLDVMSALIWRPEVLTEQGEDR